MTIPERPSGDEAAAAGRLDSWKEIAAYLRRSDRSVRRWEKEEGLPVHRHPHSQRDSVYAYRKELDEWWAGRDARVGDGSGEMAATSSPARDSLAGEIDVETVGHAHGDAALPPSGRRRIGRVAVGLALAAVVAAGSVAWLSRNGSRTTGTLGMPPFQARDWVLVANFENRTGEKQLDGTIDYALMRELSNSRYVNVVPRERVLDTLRLMRKPPDARIDSGTGREICLRDGGIRALVSGRIERLGSKYVMAAEVLEPGPEKSIGSVSETVDREEDLLPAIRRISDRIRAKLGEALPRTSDDASLEKVTTPSLEALRLYSRADALIDLGSYGAAEELLRQAIVEDPDFASAHMLLADTMANQSRPPTEIMPEAETAFRLSRQASIRERYFIRGSYYGFRGEHDKAIAGYEALLSLYPDHYWAISNLSYEYRALGREVDGARMEVAIAKLRPNDFEANFWAAHSLTGIDPDRGPGERSRYAGCALALVTPEIEESKPGFVVWLKLQPAVERWLAGDAAGALEFATRFSKDVVSTPALNGEDAARQLGQLFVALGRLNAAEESFRHLRDPTVDLAMLSLLRGDREGLRRAAAAFVEPRGRGVYAYDDHLKDAILFARAGLLERAEHEIHARGDDPEPVLRLPGFLAVANAEIAIARGRSGEAIRQLEECVQGTPRLGKAYVLWGVESLSEALERQGNVDGAIQALEFGSRQKMEALIRGNTGIWEHNELLLARLYRQAGRIADAERVENALRAMLAVADTDHPILAALRRTPAATPASALRR